MRTPIHKAFHTLQLLTVTLRKPFTVTWVYPAVKAEPSSPVIDADTNIVPLSSSSPVMISSDFNEDLPIVSKPLAATDANDNDDDEYENVRGYQSDNMSDFVIDDDPFVENITSDVGLSASAISSVAASPLLIHTADMSGKDLGSCNE
ncbi:hypothetical protein H2248_007621 [Termitomyces sp. 'cryptogamus']|nr:hypothetical protein H2248_007621 [Termitomyces sp. 'cryptogamus']